MVVQSVAMLGPHWVHSLVDQKAAGWADQRGSDWAGCWVVLMAAARVVLWAVATVAQSVERRAYASVGSWVDDLAGLSVDSKAITLAEHLAACLVG